MKTSKLSLVILFALSLILITSCRKAEEKYLTNAVITGYDLRKCACCGGLMINFRGETKSYKGEYKLISNSQDLGISYNDSFPIFAKVKWEKDNTCGEVDVIHVTRLKRK